MGKRKQVLAGLLALVMLLSVLPGPWVKAAGQTERSAVVVEMETGEIVSGSFECAEWQTASGGKIIACYSTAADAAAGELKVTFTVEKTDEYDVWLDSSLGNADYTSTFQWKLDDGEYQAYPGNGQIEAGYEAGVMGANVPLFWSRLDTCSLEAGEHSFSILIENKRSFGDMMLQVSDLLALSPTAWKWTPEGITPPCDQSGTQAGNGEVVVEMETGQVVQGKFENGDDKKFSGGSIIACFSSEEVVSELELTFETDQEREYDIWLDSSLGNADYTSTFQWKLDDGEYQRYEGKELTEAGYDAGVWGQNVPMYWTKLRTESLTAGEHTLRILVEKKRSAFQDFMLAVFDVLMLSPSEWNWTPNGITRPVDPETMKFAFGGGTVKAQTAKQDEAFLVSVTNKCTQEVPGDATFLLQLCYRDQKVLDVKYQPDVPTSQWTADQEYSQDVEVKIPFSAPDGIYEIWAGILGLSYQDPGRSGDSWQYIGSIQVGEPVVDSTPQKVSVENLSLPRQLARGTEFELAAQLTVNKDIEKPLAYLTFYRGKELWYVAELGEIQALEADTPAAVQISGMIEEGVPDGDYSVQLGIHTFETQQDETAVSIQGGDQGTRTYKPLSYGMYKPQKTGSCQLWYVNQNHAMIWNGEPFIPIGGMVCPNYLIWYDVNNPDANRQRWEEDKQILQMLYDNGIRHIYLNINHTIDYYPAGVLEAYFDLLEQYDMTYGLQIGSSVQERDTDYYAVRASSGQITAQAAGSGTVEAVGEVDMATLGSGSITASSCKYVVIDNGSGQAVDSGDGTARLTADGKMKYAASIRASQGGDYTVYFTPWVEVRESQFVDPYKHAAVLEQKYRAFAASFRAGDHFRNFIDVLTNESGFVNAAEPVRLTSTPHQQAYVRWLRERYSTLEALNRGWGMEDSLDSFETAARLIPVYTPEDGTTGICLDMDSNRTYQVNVKRGTLWDDYILFREEGMRELNNDASDWMKSTGNTNVPSVIKHVSVLETYNINDRTVGGFDGLGGEIYGDFDTAAAKRSYPFAEAEQSAKTMWYIITECNTDENMPAKYNSGKDNWVYPSKAYMHQFFQEHLEDGAKGIYDFVVYGTMFTELNGYSYHNKPEAYQWSKEFREAVENRAEELAGFLRKGEKRCYFYPGTQSWWFTPNKRTAALGGDDYQQTRIFRMDGEMVLQTFDPAVDKDALFVNLEDAPATLVWGPELNRYLADKPEGEKVVYLGLRKDLGSLPAIDAYFTEEVIEKEDGTKIQVLKPTAVSKILAQTADGKVWALQDGDLFIISNTGWNGGPSGQYTTVNYLNLIDLDAASEKPGDGNQPGNGDSSGNGTQPGNGNQPGAGDSSGNGDQPGGGTQPGNGDSSGNGTQPGNGDSSGGGNQSGNGSKPGHPSDNAAGTKTNLRSPATMDEMRLAGRMMLFLGAGLILASMIGYRRKHNV